MNEVSHIHSAVTALWYYLHVHLFQYHAVIADITDFFFRCFCYHFVCNALAYTDWVLYFLHIFLKYLEPCFVTMDHRGQSIRET